MFGEFLLSIVIFLLGYMLEIVTDEYDKDLVEMNYETKLSIGRQLKKIQDTRKRSGLSTKKYAISKKLIIF